MIWLILYLYLAGWVITAIAILDGVRVSGEALEGDLAKWVVVMLLGAAWPLVAPVAVFVAVKS